MHRGLSLVALALVLLAGCMGGASKRSDGTAPGALFEFNPALPAVGQTIEFVSRSNGSVTEWFWDFGDGEFADGEKTTHAYAAPGIYEVQLQVRDAQARSDHAAKFLQVGAKDPNPGGLEVQIRYKVAETVVEFEPVVFPSNAAVQQYFWDFGDGETSKEPAPVHTYDEKGEYLVELRIATDKNVATTQRKVAVGVASTEPSALSDRSFVVIAVIDSGINPYHQQFAAPEFTDHPANYIDKYPAEALELPLTLDTGDYDDSRKADSALWTSVKAGKLYWIPGTRIIGAYTIEKDGTAILDDDGHGSATASDAVGDTIGTCPQCLVVAIEGGTTGTSYMQAYSWALKQPWIDVISNSWNVCLAVCEANAGLWLRQEPMGDEGTVDNSRIAVERGTEIFAAAGNGVLNAFDVPTPTYYNFMTGPDWIVTVGAADATTGATVTGTGRPFDITSMGSNWKGAAHDSVETIKSFGGTSAAAPVAAGAYAYVLREMRERVGDTGEGPRGAGVVAVGTIDGVEKKVTRAQIERAVYATARGATGMPVDLSYLPPTVYLPSSAAQFAYAGYGFVNHATSKEALKVVAGDKSVPVRENEDRWAGVDSSIRRQIWGNYNPGGDVPLAPFDFDAQQAWWTAVQSGS